ncbi:AlbA family DNA-binding domain-containing protein [Algoriphagus algorifonticola]|uniref:AlbA family DNA-binding domain-containing protein n=1 Tax=Algoriphagus algorifonticola TaxID=2593007 RepID=UPI0011A02C2A|nr:ATP-binding protein [Algoriphagus algorifonticola]
MRSKAQVFKTAIFGFVLGILLLRPLVISLYMFDMQEDRGSWGNYLLTSFNNIAAIGDIDQVAISLLFGLMGIAIALMFAARNKIFHLTSQRDKLQAVKALIRQGENQHTEFKSTLRWDLHQFKTNGALEDVVVKTIAGFMNTNEGNLIIGIDDDGQPLGLLEDYRSLKKPGRDGFEQFIMQLVSTKLGTQFCKQVEVAFYQMEGRDVCHLVIKPTRSPVYLRKGDRSHFHLRTGNSTRELDIPEALDYIEQHFNNH